MSHHGTIIIDDLRIVANSSGHAIEFDEVDGFVRGLDMSGDNGGMLWDAEGQTSSSLENSIITGNSASCLNLVDHTELLSDNVALDCESSAPATMSSSFANFTNSWFVIASSESFEMLGNSHLRWISSSDIGTPTFTGSDNIVDVMVRHPCTATLLPTAARTDGTWAAAAVQRRNLGKSQPPGQPLRR